jgi:hypothetical protein
MYWKSDYIRIEANLTNVVFTAVLLLTNWDFQMTTLD